MPRIRRKDVLAAIRVAGYYGDRERGFLLYIKNRVSLGVYHREFETGAAMRHDGVPVQLLSDSGSRPTAADRVSLPVS